MKPRLPKPSSLSVTSLAAFLPLTLFAGDAAQKVAPPEAPAEHLLGDWRGRRTQWSDHGFDLSILYGAEVIGNAAGGVKRGAIYDGLLTVNGEVNLEKAVDWKGGLLHGGMLVPHGRSLTEHYVNDLFVLSNLDASDTVRLFTLWFQQSVAEGRFSLRLGQIAVDEEFGFTEQGGLFGSSAFGWFPIGGNNIAAPIYPQGAPGVRCKWQPSAHSWFQLAVTDGDVNPTDATGRETNPHGVKVRFDEGAFIIAEIGGKWDGRSGPAGLKLGGWYVTADTADKRRASNRHSLADPRSTGEPRKHGGNWGLYLAGEQIVWKEATEGSGPAAQTGIFGRLGYAPADRNMLDFYAEAGVTRTGLIAGRKEDVCGLGVAFGKMGDLRGLERDRNTFGRTRDPLPDYELVIEVDYQWKLCRGCTVQPSIQYIAHPGGSGRVDNALIFGLRNTLDF